MIRELVFYFFFATLSFFTYAQCSGPTISYFPSTVNGITVTQTYTGDVSYAGVSNTFSGCGVTACPTILGSSVLTGSPFMQTLTFSNPVNNIVYALNGADSVPGDAETFTFSVDIGSLSVNQSGGACLFTQSGNTLNANTGIAPGNCAYLILTSTMAYNSITVFGSGGHGGSCMALCSSSIGITERNISTNAMVYPNPSSGTFSLRGFSHCGPKAEIEVFDISGTLLYYDTSEIKNGSVELNLKLVNGIYSIRARHESGESQIAKLVICR